MLDHVITLLLPGWQDSGPLHWQSRWQTAHGFVRVVQANWMEPHRPDWIAQLDTVIAQTREPVALVAHSLGCHLVAAWAAAQATRPRLANVRGALLVAPPDCEQADFPDVLVGWRPPALASLPFPSICVTSQNDPYDRAGTGSTYARAWGSQLVNAGAVGHLNSESGLGDWPTGLALVRALWAESDARAGS